MTCLRQTNLEATNVWITLWTEYTTICLHLIQSLNGAHFLITRPEKNADMVEPSSSIFYSSSNKFLSGNRNKLVTEMVLRCCYLGIKLYFAMHLPIS